MIEDAHYASDPALKRMRELERDSRRLHSLLRLSIQPFSMIKIVNYEGERISNIETLDYLLEVEDDYQERKDKDRSRCE